MLLFHSYPTYILSSFIPPATANLHGLVTAIVPNFLGAAMLLKSHVCTIF